MNGGSRFAYPPYGFCRFDAYSSGIRACATLKCAGTTDAPYRRKPASMPTMDPGLRRGGARA
jgi:hypothetical protein